MRKYLAGLLRYLGVQKLFYDLVQNFLTLAIARLDTLINEAVALNTKVATTNTLITSTNAKLDTVLAALGTTNTLLTTNNAYLADLTSILTRPAGYTATWSATVYTQPYVTSGQALIACTRPGSTYHYSVSTSGGASTLTGTGTVSATTLVLDLDFTSLEHGTLTLQYHEVHPTYNLPGCTVVATTIWAVDPPYVTPTYVAPNYTLP
jgi:hypothetical protein